MSLVAKFFRVQVLFCLLAVVNSDDNPQPHHHRHHRHHRNHSNSSTMVTSQHSAGRENVVPNASKSARSVGAVAPPTRHAHTAAASATKVDVVNAAIVSLPAVSEEQILHKIRDVEKGIQEKEQAPKPVVAKGRLNVNGPLPADFSDRFAQGVADATGCRAADVVLVGAVPVPEAQGSMEEVIFRSSRQVVEDVEDQAANPDSRLANGLLHTFLVARDGPDADEPAEEEAASEPEPHAQPRAAEAPEVDMSMPYGDLEPFGREDTAQELTESSIHESNAMVDQLEKAEVAEERRAVFRALTRLRGAAITSYDGIARSQTGNIDDYARSKQWRKVHPVHHLADDEADVSKWAFPDSDGDES